MAENVILIDKHDRMIGTIDKMRAHYTGKLHRAFSVFVFNTAGELLLQQRALDKYHSGGKWTNTCCSHPRLGEDTLVAAHRRLFEEMGLTSDLNEVFNFTYRAELEGGLIEHELDHVFFGICDSLPAINPAEVADFKYVTIDKLEQDMENDPAQFTAWLNICFQLVKTEYQQWIVPQIKLR